MRDTVEAPPVKAAVMTPAWISATGGAAVTDGGDAMPELALSDADVSVAGKGATTVNVGGDADVAAGVPVDSPPHAAGVTAATSASK